MGTDGHGWTRIKNKVDANYANWREFGHKECKEHKMKDLHAASFHNKKRPILCYWVDPYEGEKKLVNRKERKEHKDNGLWLK